MSVQDFDYPEQMFDENGDVVPWTDELRARWLEFRVSLENEPEVPA